MDVLTTTLTKVLSSVPYYVAIAMLLLIGKWVFDRTTKYAFDEELTVKDNPAFGATLALYLVGLAVALSGLSFGIGNKSPIADFANIAVYGVLTVILMRASVWVNDNLILYKFCIHKEISEDQNIGTAFVVGGGCLATGFVILGALSGESVSFMLGIRDLLVYWMVGQGFLVVGGLVFQLVTSYDVHKIIEHDDNVAAGLSFGGFLTAVGLITKSALSGAGSELGVELLTTVVIAASGIILLIPVRIITDKFLLPNSSLSKEVAVDANPAAGAVAAASFIALGLAFAAAMAA